MTELTADDLRADYLARLDEAMRNLPHGVASDIRAGILEELQGLDAEATAARIAHLGDPVVIADEAQAEVPSATIVGAPTIAAAPTPRPPATSTRGFAIAAALTLSFGGIVVPVVGWFVGAALVSASALWRTWEKAIAIVVPFVVTGISFLTVSTLTALASSETGSSSSGTGTPPEVPAVNPLVPGVGEWHVLILLGFLLVPLSGLWLLWRLRGRTAG
ncbi:HAAS signaling domain-containing protein [Microbacterium maritypicum]|uniref:HAAS signaling domain-containing protein n=1 Tax=Microbacterium maritypicum TaxID=33918 RepID=UPI00381EAF50